MGDIYHISLNSLNIGADISNISPGRGEYIEYIARRIYRIYHQARGEYIGAKYHQSSPHLSSPQKHNFHLEAHLPSLLELLGG